MPARRTHIRVGIGGWNYAGWRGTFYPPGLRAADELAWASQRLGCIEINASYYATPSPESWARWAQQVPTDFVFSVKAHRMATARRELLAGADAAEHFLQSGLAVLGPRLGPIVWQLPPHHAFDADDLEPFLALLPDAIDGLPLRHVLEPRHPSFACAAYLTLARAYGVATVCTDSPDFPQLFDPTGDFIYARLMRSQPELPTGYAPGELAQWAERARIWQAGSLPPDLPLIDPAAARALPAAPRDVFVQFISGAKARNPAAAQTLMTLLDAPPSPEAMV